jgi:hypothetical protein
MNPTGWRNASEEETRLWVDGAVKVEAHPPIPQVRVNARVRVEGGK